MFFKGATPKVIGPDLIKITNDSHALEARLEDLARYVLKAAWHIFGIPNFRYYVLADGMRTMLWKTRGASES